MNNIALKYRIFIKLVVLISKTWRINIIGKLQTECGIIAFWHSEMLPMWKYFGKLNSTAIISRSNDGEILSQIVKSWNVDVIRGSSAVGGSEVMKEMIEIAKSKFILITPDGPKGPKNKMKAGTVVTSLRANVPIYLCNSNFKSKIIFKNSWDLFQFPLPFTKIDIVISEPIYLDYTEDRDVVNSYILQLENKLNQIDA